MAVWVTIFKRPNRSFASHGWFHIYVWTTRDSRSETYQEVGVVKFSPETQFHIDCSESRRVFIKRQHNTGLFLISRQFTNDTIPRSHTHWDTEISWAIRNPDSRSKRTSFHSSTSSPQTPSRWVYEACGYVLLMSFIFVSMRYQWSSTCRLQLSNKKSLAGAAISCELPVSQWMVFASCTWRFVSDVRYRVYLLFWRKMTSLTVRKDTIFNACLVFYFEVYVLTHVSLCW